MNTIYELARMFEPDWNPNNVAGKPIICECGNTSSRVDCKEVLSDETRIIAGQEYEEYSYYCPSCGMWLRTDYVLKEQENEYDN